MLMATTEMGLCAVFLGNCDADLHAQLQARFADRKLIAAPGRLAKAARAVLAYLNGGCRSLELPIDVTGTAFQLMVWERLRHIPYGETRTYAEVAQSISRPTAARAVARACAANPLSIIIPCHRVVGSDGSLRGYRWGAQRKRALLALEHEVAKASGD